MLSLRRAACGAPGVGLVLGLVLLPAARAAAARYTFEATISSECLWGRVPSRPRSTSSSGMEVARAWTRWTSSPTRRDAGSDASRSRWWGSGRKISATDGLTKRTLRIPVLTARADRVGDTVRGKGPAHSRVRVVAERCGLDSPCQPRFDRRTRTGATGRYRVDSSSVFDARGHGSVEVTFRSARGDKVTRFGRFSSFGPSVGLGLVTGTLAAGQSTGIVLRDGLGGAVLASETVTGDAVGRWFLNVLPDASKPVTSCARGSPRTRACSCRT